MTEADRYSVKIKVISQKGTCNRGHKLGDEWLIKNDDCQTPQGLCVYAFGSLYPFTNVLMFGGSFPWDSEPDITTGVCPDPGNPVVFELRRLPK